MEILQMKTEKITNKYKINNVSTAKTEEFKISLRNGFSRNLKAIYKSK